MILIRVVFIANKIYLLYKGNIFVEIGFYIRTIFYIGFHFIFFF